MTITLPENYHLPRGHKIDDVISIHPIQTTNIVLCVKQSGEILVLKSHGYCCYYPQTTMWRGGRYSISSIKLRPKEQMLIKTTVDNNIKTINN